MKKISLEELKARSEDLGYYPHLIEIARVAKSPTAAFELAKSRRVNYPDLAQGCRYLAMIKRDYGKEAFAQTAADIQKSANINSVLFNLQPYIQTANRLSFLCNCLQNYPSLINEEFLKLHPSDEYYIDIVDALLKCFDETESSIKQKFFELLGDEYYLKVANMFVEIAQANKTADRYRLEKTVKVIQCYVKAVAWKVGIQFNCRLDDCVFSYAMSIRHQKTSE
ncbi:MAG TPA: hypothetical protein VK254_01145 [Candidatus Bathyarchaeia archaeon]|nr:hypothetical protein [Candidatus Bathyarchaeia archaeon]